MTIEERANLQDCQVLLLLLSARHHLSRPVLGCMDERSLGSRHLNFLKKFNEISKLVHSFSQFVCVTNDQLDVFLPASYTAEPVNIRLGTAKDSICCNYYCWKRFNGMLNIDLASRSACWYVHANQQLRSLYITWSRDAGSFLSEEAPLDSSLCCDVTTGAYMGSVNRHKGARG